MRSTLGIAVFSGMLGVTLFGIFLTPVFYYVIVRLFQSSPAQPVEPSKEPVRQPASSPAEHVAAATATAVQKA